MKKSLKKIWWFAKSARIFASQFEGIVNGLVVQLVRMPPCHGGGRGFESRPDRKKVHRVFGVLFFLKNIPPPVSVIKKRVFLLEKHVFFLLFC
ncbi:MAG: hypothetical protein RL757_2893 [Bacteroidota bacterium]